MTEEELNELEKAAERYPVAASHAMLKLISAYRDLKRDAELWQRMAWNEGVLSTRERICLKLMPKYGSHFGHEVWAIEIDDPFPKKVKEKRDE